MQFGNIEIHVVSMRMLTNDVGNNARHMTNKTMLNKTDYREVTVSRNDLYIVGLVATRFDDDVRSNVQ